MQKSNPMNVNNRCFEKEDCGDLKQQTASAVGCSSVADSGYGAENSPASLTPLTFSLGEFVSEGDVPEEGDEVFDIDEIDDVFGNFNPRTAGGGFETQGFRNLAIEERQDDTDRELHPDPSGHEDESQALSMPIGIRYRESPDQSGDYPCLRHSCNGSFPRPSSVPARTWARQKQHRIVFGHTCGTQTIDCFFPGPQHPGEFEDSTEEVRSRRRLSIHIPQSSSSQSPLPDVIPQPRGRSVSTSAVPSMTRTESQLSIGRELRRISDEFHHTRAEKHGKTVSSSVPSSLTFDLHAYWTGLRRIVSTPLFRPGTSQT